MRTPAERMLIPFRDMRRMYKYSDRVALCTNKLKLMAVPCKEMEHKSVRWIF